MKIRIKVRRERAWSVWAEFFDEKLWTDVQAGEAKRVAAYDAERAAAETKREAERDKRRHEQMVAIHRKETPPASLDDADLTTPLPPELTEQEREPRKAYTPTEFVQLFEPGAYITLIATTALAVEQNGWADEVRLEVVENGA